MPLLRCFRENRPCLSEKQIDFILRHSLAVLLISLVLTAAALAHSIGNFRIDTDLSDMVSRKLQFRQDYLEYRKAFPLLADEIVVVVEGATPEVTRYARDLLFERLEGREDLFGAVYAPGGGDFFARNGLLFKDLAELQQLTDRLARFQPFLALLTRDFSLEGLAQVLEQLIEQAGPDADRLEPLFRGLSQALDRVRLGSPVSLSWERLLLDEADSKPPRQFILVEPHLDYRRLYPAAETMQEIRREAAELPGPVAQQVEIRLTGEVALNHQDLKSVQGGIGAAALLSLLLIGGVLYLGLRSVRLVALSLCTLAVGLSWTLGITIAFLGRLNLISVTFVVLFIGIGIDYSIQFCLRYREFTGSGMEDRAAIAAAARHLGNPFLLCTLTTALGFYSFVPTAYVGASELGLIAGTGMFLNAAANLVVLPALLHRIPGREAPARLPMLPLRVAGLPITHPGTILVAAVILACGAVLLLPRVQFDLDPLNLADPDAEAVRTARELFRESRTSPWTLSVVAENREQADRLADQMDELPQVDAAVTLSDFVPPRQEEKLTVIADLALFLPPVPNSPPSPPLHLRGNRKAWGSLRQALTASIASSAASPDEAVEARRRLNESLRNFIALLEDPARGPAALEALSNGLLLNLWILLKDLETSQQARTFAARDLPEVLRRQYVSAEGRYLVEVVAGENLTRPGALESFVEAAQSLAPQATGASVTLLESGRAIVSAFRAALMLALLLISFLLLALLQKPKEVLLVLAPLLLSMVLTMGIMVLLGISFNFANVIVIPLLLGIGVDYSLHLLHRSTEEEGQQKPLLQTSTGRGILFSGLTTIVSFGTLAFLSHRGTASMGVLLTLGIALTLLCTLLVLPALLQRYGRTGAGSAIPSAGRRS